MTDNIMTVIGYHFGTFTNDKGERIEFDSLFMAEPFGRDSDDNYHFEGQRAAKYTVADKTLLDGIKPGMQVRCFFDARKRIALIQPIGADAARKS